MAYSVSSRWEQHIRRGAVPVTEVDIHMPGQGITFTNLPVSSGSITFSRENAYRASGSLIIADPDLFPTLDNPSILEPYGAEITIRTGIVYPEGIGSLRAHQGNQPNLTEHFSGLSATELAEQGHAEMVPLGIFPIQTVSGTEANGRIPEVSFFDRGKRLEDYSFVAPKDVGGQLIQDVIEAEILDSDIFYPVIITGIPQPGGLVLDATSGSYCSTPDNSNLNIITQIDVRVDCTLDDWTPPLNPDNKAFAAQWDQVSNQRSWAFVLTPNGELRMYYSSSGTGTSLTTSVAIDSHADVNGRLAVRVVFNEDTGNADFYTAPTMAGPWTLRDNNTFTPVNLHNTTTLLEFGSSDGGTANLFEGTIHSAFVLVDTTKTIADINFYDLETGTTGFTNSGFTYTVHGSAEIVNINSAGSLPWTVNFDAALDNFPLPAGTLIDIPRWEFLERMAESLGADIFFYRDGNVYVIPVPGIYGEGTIPDPNWIIDAGEDGILIDADRSVSRDSVFNGVVVIGSTDDETSPQPFALVTDDNPQSLTRWGGPFGKSLLRIENSDLTTSAQCEIAARAELRNVSGLQRNLGFGSIGNPAMDPGDILRVDFPDDSSEIHMLDSYTYEFPTMSLSGETRSIQYIPPES